MPPPLRPLLLTLSDERFRTLNALTPDVRSAYLEAAMSAYGPPPISTRPQLAAPPAAELRAHYATHTLRQLAARYGVNYGVIRKWVRAAGIVVRSPGGPALK
ncbi:MAG: helix-turn-helix domain-containing protein [Janthinobacterium lividum]